MTDIVCISYSRYPKKSFSCTIYWFGFELNWKWNTWLKLHFPLILYWKYSIFRALEFLSMCLTNTSYSEQCKNALVFFRHLTKLKSENSFPLTACGTSFFNNSFSYTSLSMRTIGYLVYRFVNSNSLHTADLVNLRICFFSSEIRHFCFIVHIPCWDEINRKIAVVANTKKLLGAILSESEIVYWTDRMVGWNWIRVFRFVSFRNICAVLHRTQAKNKLMLQSSRRESQFV